MDAISVQLQGEVVADRYKVKHKIGQGSFGDIFLATDLVTSHDVAIKVEPKSSKYPQLRYEYRVYRSMSDNRGLPTILWCGEHGRFVCLVMDLLGESLEALFNKCGRKFTLKTILMLAVQMLDRIEHEHDHNYLHRDIKPDNFLMGRPPLGHVLYIIDMGLSKRYRDPETHEHIPYRDRKKLTGTPRYASINTHHGIEQARRDDLESMGYMLLYFLLGRLPWQGLKAKTKQEKYDKIGAKKMQTDIATLCQGYPGQFVDFFTYVRHLKFRERPNYKYLRRLFYDLFREKQYVEDFMFDWMYLKDYEEARRCAEHAVCHATKKNMPSKRYHYNFLSGDYFDETFDDESVASSEHSRHAERKIMDLMDQYEALEHRFNELRRQYQENLSTFRVLDKQLTMIKRNTPKVSQAFSLLQTLESAVKKIPQEAHDASKAEAKDANGENTTTSKRKTASMGNGNATTKSSKRKRQKTDATQEPAAEKTVDEVPQRVLRRTSSRRSGRQTSKSGSK